jgi:hypothetical protein
MSVGSEPTSTPRTFCVTSAKETAGYLDLCFFEGGLSGSRANPLPSSWPRARDFCPAAGLGR